MDCRSRGNSAQRGASSEGHLCPPQNLQAGRGQAGTGRQEPHRTRHCTAWGFEKALLPKALGRASLQQERPKGSFHMGERLTWALEAASSGRCRWKPVSPGLSHLETSSLRLLARTPRGAPRPWSAMTPPGERGQDCSSDLVKQHPPPEWGLCQAPR